MSVQSIVIITAYSIVAICIVNMLGVNAGTIIVSVFSLIVAGILVYDTNLIVKCGRSTWAWFRTAVLLTIQLCLVSVLIYKLRVDKDKLKV
jgi:hypothetical protein